MDVAPLSIMYPRVPQAYLQGALIGLVAALHCWTLPDVHDDAVAGHLL